MSDLDTELRGLRDELNAAIPLPDFERVTGRARNRRRLQLVTIVAVVAAVALAVPLLRAARSTPATKDSQRTSYVLDFADPDHGYAMARTCMPGASDCAFVLYRTADGGRTWGRRQLPPALNPTTGYRSATMYVLGPDAITIDRPDGDVLDRINSTDGGRSWDRTEPPDKGGFSAPLADGALLTARCGAQPYSKATHCPDVGTIQPGTGSFVATPTQPPLVPDQIGPAPTRDGRYWVIGRRPGTVQYSIALSADGGRTWSVSDLPRPGAGVTEPEFVEVGTWSVVANEDALYVVAGDYVWSSTDGGRSWTYASSRDSAHPTQAAVGSPIAAADRSLLVSDGTNVWRSTDRGRAFVKTDREPFGVKWTRGGYLWLKFDEFALSSDGLAWREFSVR
jgi:photosystem II stability/assembly factor-like uncharacterized protein